MLDYASVTGPESAPTVVLLHPAGGTRHTWTPHVDALAAQYRVVTVDLPGHGAHPESTFDFERAVADVDRILDAEGPAILVGHSQGGYVAIRAAAAHADRVDGLLLAGSGYDWRTPRLLVLSTLFTALSGVLATAARSTRVNEWFEARTDDYGPDQAPPPDADAHPALRGHASAMRATAFQATWPLVDAFEGPVRIVHGTDEACGDHAERLADRTNGDLHWVEGGHHAPATDPDSFVPVIADFVDEHTTGTDAPESTNGPVDTVHGF